LVTMFAWGIYEDTKFTGAMVKSRRSCLEQQCES
jgi:hypothetical protein